MVCRLSGHRHDGPKELVGPLPDVRVMRSPRRYYRLLSRLLRYGARDALRSAEFRSVRYQGWYHGRVRSSWSGTSRLADAKVFFAAHSCASSARTTTSTRSSWRIGLCGSDPKPVGLGGPGTKGSLLVERRRGSLGAPPGALVGSTPQVSTPREGSQLAYLLTHFWPGATEDQYRATVAVVHPPNGGPAAPDLSRRRTDRGRVSDRGRMGIQGSTADRFVSDVLLASMPVEGGFTGRPEERTAEIVNLITAPGTG